MIIINIVIAFSIVMEIRIRTSVHPTEDLVKIKRCISNIVDIIDFDIEKGKKSDYLFGKSHDRTDLEPLYQKIRSQKILDTCRGILFKNIREDTTRLHLNKQVLYMGHVNISFDPPMGPIELELQDDDIEGLIDWLCPETREGKEI